MRVEETADSDTTREGFVDMVVSAMMTIHNEKSSRFLHLVPAIAAAYDDEGGITDDELCELAYGQDGRDDDNYELMRRYPRLESVFCEPFLGELSGWDELRQKWRPLCRCGSFMTRLEKIGDNVFDACPGRDGDKSFYHEVKELK